MRFHVTLRMCGVWYGMPGMEGMLYWYGMVWYGGHVVMGGGQ